MPEKILIIAFDAIGDYIMFTPFLRQLKENMPDSEITIIAHRRNIDVIRKTPYVDKVIHFSRQDKLSFLQTLVSVRKNKYDLLIDAWFASFSTMMKYIVKFAKADVRITLDKTVKRDVLKNYYDLVLPYRKDLHSCLRFDPILEYLNISTDYSRNYFYPENAEVKHKAENFVKSLPTGKNILLVCNGSRIDNTLPIDTIRELIKIFLERGGINILLSSAPMKDNPADMLEKEFGSERVHSLPSIDATLDFTAMVVSMSDLVLSTSTAIMHIAGAYDTPVLGIFPDDDDMVANLLPISKKHVVVRSFDKFNSFPIDINATSRKAFEML